MSSGVLPSYFKGLERKDGLISVDWSTLSSFRDGTVKKIRVRLLRRDVYGKSCHFFCDPDGWRTEVYGEWLLISPPKQAPQEALRWMLVALKF